VLLFLVAISNAIQWKVWQVGNTKVVRVIQVEKSPPAFPFTFEARAVDATFNQDKELRLKMQLISYFLWQ